MAINQFSGCFVLINYSATIFRDSGSELNPNMSSIILAAVQILGTYVSTILVDRVGRKILLIVSAASTSGGLAIMGLYSYLDKHGWDMQDLDWVPVTSLSFVIFIASIGILPLPFVVLAEVLPQNVSQNSIKKDFSYHIMKQTIQKYFRFEQLDRHCASLRLA